MRVVVAIAVFALGCSPSQGVPSEPAGPDGGAITRRYAYDCPLPVPAKTSAPSTYSGIYEQIISDKSGVAKCQNGACHGGGAVNYGLNLGTTKLSAYCGLAKAYTIDSANCTMCDFCNDEIVSATACGSNAGGPSHPCCKPCAPDADAGTSADAGDDPTGFDSIVKPDQSDPMPRTLCGNRLLNADELKAVHAWGKAGFPYD